MGSSRFVIAALGLLLAGCATHPGDGRLSAPNRAHGLRTFVGEEGFEVVSRTVEAEGEEGFRLVFTLASFGRGPARNPVGSGFPEQDEGRVDLIRPGLTEWLVNREEGLEHGFTLQIDAPDLAMERHTYFADRPLAEFITFIEQVGDRINRALTDVPKDRVRLHVCWGNYEGPHDEDVPLEAIWPALQTINVGAVLLSMANPRHSHEYRVLAKAPWPDNLTLVAGVIDTTTNYIEHPDAIADRLVLAAEAIGAPERLMAGTDCGFETSAGFSSVVDEIAWQKLGALVEGADRASRMLFG